MSNRVIVFTEVELTRLCVHTNSVQMYQYKQSQPRQDLLLKYKKTMFEKKTIFLGVTAFVISVRYCMYNTI
jgi:hypothetical protein